MGILMFMGSLVATLINKLWWLAYVGSAVIAWTGAAMVFEDPLIHRQFDVGTFVQYASCLVVTGLTLGISHLLRRRREEV
jgi:predicted tellurium resistance membrane protein TerC